ncbi:hypothetical protein Tco_0370544 [Tanacetum coccineum]
MILSRPFLETIHAEIDVFNKENSLGIGDDRITFDMDKKIYNFATPIGKVYMVKSIQNDESHVLPDVSSTTPSIDRQGDNTYWWHDHGLEENERQESGLDIEEYDPLEVHVETFKIKVQGNDLQRGGHRRKVPKKDVASS